MHMNSKGMSLIEAAITTAIVVGSAFVVGQYATVSTETVKQAADLPTISSVGQLTLSRAQTTLLNVGPGSNQGICRIMSTPVRSGGVGRVNLDLPATGLTHDSLAPDWAAAFPTSEWEWMSDAECAPTTYKKCFRPLAGLPGMTEEMVNTMKPRVEVHMIPIRVRGATGSTENAVELSPTDLRTENARDIAFLLTAYVKYIGGSNANGPVLKTQKRQLAVWAGEVSCLYNTGGPAGTIYLNPSGIGSGVAADTLFSDSTETTADRMLSVRFLNTVRVESQVRTVNGVRRGDSIRTAESMATVACSEVRWKCRNRPGARQWAAQMPTAMQVMLNRTNNIYPANVVRSNPQYYFANRNGQRHNVTAQYSIGSTGVSTTTPPQLTYLSTYLTAVVNILNGDQVCPNICREQEVDGVKFNWTASNISDNSAVFRAVLRNDFVGVTRDGAPYSESETDGKTVACTCCQMKECGRIGVNSWGYCHNLPPEPLDSRIPECAGSDDGLVGLARYSDAPLGSGGRGCIAAYVQAGELRFERRSCGESHKPLCYFQGGFRMARNGITGTYDSADFSGARQLCYDMGRERARVADLDRLLQAQGNFDAAKMPPKDSSGNWYEFVNGAIAGLFLAPQGADQRAQAVAAAADVPLAAGERFWVALETDSDNKVVASVPVLPPVVSPFISFSDTSSRLNFERDPDHTFNVSAPNRLAMFHSRRYFGAAAINGSQPPPSTAINVLCTDPATGLGVRATASTRQFTDGLNLCKNAGYVFLPPVTPAQWINAMLATSVTENFLNWPPPGAAMASWVGMELNGSSWQTSLALRPGNGGMVSVHGEQMEPPYSPMPYEPAYSLCRTGNDADPFELKPYPAQTCGTFAGTNPYGTVLTRDAILKMVRQLGAASTDAIALKPYPRCSAPDGRYHQVLSGSMYCPAGYSGSRTQQCDGTSWTITADTCRRNCLAGTAPEPTVAGNHGDAQTTACSSAQPGRSNRYVCTDGAWTLDTSRADKCL